MGKGDHLLVVGLGIELAVIMCAGFFAGYFLDVKFNAVPLFTLILSALAFVLGIYVVVKSAVYAVDKGKK
jgi:F0F1-type ATP synthase assembly protein I